MTLARMESLQRQHAHSQFESSGLEDIHTIFVFQYVQQANILNPQEGPKPNFRQEGNLLIPDVESDL